MYNILSRNILNVRRLLSNSMYILNHEVSNISKMKFINLYSTDELKNISDDGIHKNEEEHNLAVGVKSEYKVFRDEDANVIFDVDEEQKRLDLKIINELDQTPDPYEGLNMKHGKNGVFDIEDLVEILKKDKAQNIFVATVPLELSYVDYIVIVTARSNRHMSALATYIRKAYKLKRYASDLLPKIEGEKSKDWVAIDLGNIALHIFSSEARVRYSLELLWTVGSEYDKETHNVDYEIEFKNHYSGYLAGFQPADELESSS